MSAKMQFFSGLRLARPILNGSMSEIISYIDFTHPGAGYDCSETCCGYPDIGVFSP
ncbi:hypothetical protein M1O16_04910 [Dehalococcoidia bacterium]|nr:hypothetical protein [Dehalococcoidia bacterium]